MEWRSHRRSKLYVIVLCQSATNSDRARPSVTEAQDRMWLEIVLVLIIVVLLAIFDTIKPKHFPPGPPWLPVLGNLLDLKTLVEETKYHHEAWARLAARYGPVVGVRLGRTPPLVVVSGRKAVQEALAKEDFDGRPDGFIFRFRTMGKRRGVLFTDGEEWRDQRRFLLRNLRDFGFGKRSMEALILEEAESLVKRLRSEGSQHKSDGVPMQSVFAIPVLNSLWSMIAGIRFEEDDPYLVKFIELNKQLLRRSDSTGGILNHVPFLRHFPPKKAGFDEFAEIQRNIWDFIRGFIWDHRSTLSEHVSRDLIDVYLKELQSDKVGKLAFSEMELVAVIRDLFAAGSETTSNQLSFAILHMVLNPECQKRVQEEVDLVVGRDRAPALGDKHKMPYTSAVLMEVQRRSPVLAMTLPHRSFRETQLDGYTIPAGSTVLMSLWSLHMDQEHWGDPRNFRPERFIDPNGRLVSDPWFVPFGAGRRRCLGETMAKASLFLFFTSLLQNLSFSLPEGQPTPCVEGINGFSVITVPFNTTIHPR